MFALSMKVEMTLLCHLGNHLGKVVNQNIVHLFPSSYTSGYQVQRDSLKKTWEYLEVVRKGKRGPSRYVGEMVSLNRDGAFKWEAFLFGGHY